MAAGQVTFNDGTNPAVTVGGVVFPEQQGYSYPMLRGRTMGGGILTADMGDGTDWTDPVVTFRGMSNADYEDMRDFFRTTVNWSEDSFTYTDPNGTAYTNMHYWDGLNTFVSAKNNRWAGTIRLVKDMSV